jgi:hypothetical protein
VLVVWQFKGLSHEIQLDEILMILYNWELSCIRWMILKFKIFVFILKFKSIGFTVSFIAWYKYRYGENQVANPNYLLQSCQAIFWLVSQSKPHHAGTWLMINYLYSVLEDLPYGERFQYYSEKISHRTNTCQWQAQGYEWHSEPPF